MIVETAARVRDLQYQSSLDREKVRQFMIDYQDRVAYGTDLGVRPDADPEQAIARARDGRTLRFLIECGGEAS